MHFRSSLCAAVRCFSSTASAVDRLSGDLHAVEQFHRFVVVGGGAAGCATASSLSRSYPNQVAVIEPADVHHNQPAWTLVGAGIKHAAQTRRSMASVMPPKVFWLHEAAVSFQPARNTVITQNKRIHYDYLVVACGLAIRFQDIKGLPEALASPFVSSNYDPTLCSKTWDCIQRMQKGNAIFTYPSGPVKCGGAGQKVAYLADDYWRKHGVRDSISISYNTALPRVFGAAYYADALEPLCASRDIEVGSGMDLAEVRPESREAVFRKVLGPDKGRTIIQKYDFMHVVPKQAAHACLLGSELASGAGFVDVDSSTLQHKKFSNVFALGDCSSLPTSKTAAAVSAQIQVLLPNLEAAVQAKPLLAQYNGYTSCPILTKYGKVMMCEFDYDAKPCETFPFLDQRRANWLMWWTKTQAIPFVYWRLLLKGYAPWRKIPKFVSGLGKS